MRHIIDKYITYKKLCGIQGFLFEGVKIGKCVWCIVVTFNNFNKEILFGILFICNQFVYHKLCGYTSVASAVNCRIKSVTTIQVVKSLRIDTTLVR